MDVGQVQSGRYGNLVGAVDQGTSSTRFLVFASRSAELLTYHQVETKQYYPEAGWVEQDPYEILSSVQMCIEKTVEKLVALEVDPGDIKAIGITNQRETTIVWDRFTGKPLYNAIIWLDSRTVGTVEKLQQKRGAKFVKLKSGLPISTYFSAVKLRWILDNVPEVSDAIRDDRCLFGTVDSWLIWNLSGGTSGGVHMTDVTNASRTMLMNIETLQWDDWLCKFFEIPTSVLPEIRSSSEVFAFLSEGSLKGVPISGCLGDQNGALVGQMCFRMGQAKSTYGTGCFLLYNTGRVPVYSDHGLLTTVGYKLGPNEPVFYALEGSVAIAGACVRWLRDNMEMIKNSSEVETLACSVESTHGVYFVPAFSGLYAPYWQSDARGIICGLTQFTSKAHIARAALEAVCFQTKEILDAMNMDCGVPMLQLQVDGGMTENNLLMQLQADLLGIPVVRPSMPETTALGVAMAAGAAQGVEVWCLKQHDLSVITTDTFIPFITEDEREHRYERWKKAVRRCMRWESTDSNKSSVGNRILRSLPGGIFLMSSFAILLLADKLAKR